MGEGRVCLQTYSAFLVSAKLTRKSIKHSWWGLSGGDSTFNLVFLVLLSAQICGQ